MVVAAAERTAELIQQRREQGLDRFDEVWDGVLHMNPPPRFDHQRVVTQFIVAVARTVEATGLEVVHEAGLFDPDLGLQNYRQPDVLIMRPEHITERGVEGGCELVVEVRSPHDETFLKFDFYAANHVQQILVIEPTTRTAELYELDDSHYVVVPPDADGTLPISCAAITVRTDRDGDSPRLVVETPNGIASF